MPAFLIFVGCCPFCNITYQNITGMKNIFFILFLIILFSCNKKSGPKITKENVKEALIQYGKENPDSDVTINTAYGYMRIRLYDDTPLHRANFIKLINEDYYGDANFYRIVQGFVIQGGDMSRTYDYLIPAEFNPDHFHKKGAVAMARSDDNNPKKESSATEFYIMQGIRYTEEDIDTDAANEGLTLTPAQRQAYLTVGGDMSLDQKYTVFGEVVEGLDVIDKLANVKVYGEKPLQKVPFKIFLTKDKEASF
jgi:cyclophilin family peptidyl-prolyl cis-trans isomerase